MIDWDAQPLGQLRDADLARNLGVMVSLVRAARRQRGIPAFVPPSSRSARGALPLQRIKRDIDWDAEPLGQLPDAELARRLGKPIDWTRWKLGKAPDAQLAEVLGVPLGVVARARMVLGLPKPRKR